MHRNTGLDEKMIVFWETVIDSFAMLSNDEDLWRFFVKKRPRIGCTVSDDSYCYRRIGVVLNVLPLYPAY